MTPTPVPSASLVASLALLLAVLLHHCRAPVGAEARALAAMECVREAQGPGAADRCLEALRWGDSLRAGLSEQTGPAGSGR